MKVFLRVKTVIKVTLLSFACVTLLSACQGLATKPSDKFDDRSVSFLVYGFKLHLQGTQRIEASWIDEHRFIDRTLDVYENKLGKPLDDRPMSADKDKVFYGIVNSLYGLAPQGCDQFDAELQGELLNVLMECDLGEGFMILNVLLSYRDGTPKLVDIKPLSNATWYSELIGLIMADPMDLTKIKSAMAFIREVKAGQVDYAKYYAMNAYIKQNKMLAMNLNSVTSDKNIQKEVSLALEELCPQDPYCALSVLDYYVDAKQMHKVIEKLEIAKQHFPRSHQVNTLLAGIYLLMDLPKQALATGQDAIWIKPSAHEGYMLVLNAAAVLEDEEQASIAAAALQKGFNLGREQITTEYNKRLLAKPEFWQKVQQQAVQTAQADES